MESGKGINFVWVFLSLLWFFVCLFGFVLFFVCFFYFCLFFFFCFDLGFFEEFEYSSTSVRSVERENFCGY